MSLVKEKVILLRKVKYGESDLILHALNSKGAKMGFLAKGALKSKKRFGGGVLEPTHYLLVAYTHKKSRSSDEDPLFFLNEAQLLRDFLGIRNNYESLQQALSIVQLVDKISFPGMTHSEGVFNLLGHVLRALETSKDPGFLRTQFELKLLYQQGILPKELIIEPLLKFSLSDHELARAEVGDIRSPVFLKNQSKVNELLYQQVNS